MRVHFKALESALIGGSKAPKHQSTKSIGALDGTMVQKIIENLQNNPSLSQEVLAQNIGTTRRIIQKYMKALQQDGRIDRIGGKRYGHWQVKE